MINWKSFSYLKGKYIHSLSNYCGTGQFVVEFRPDDYAYHRCPDPDDLRYHVYYSESIYRGGGGFFRMEVRRHDILAQQLETVHNHLIESATVEPHLTYDQNYLDQCTAFRDMLFSDIPNLRNL